jgi:hypothetical protein
MKVPSSVSKLLENKYVLYIVFFLAVTNVFGYMVTGNYKAIALFVLVGYLVFCFNKNMIVVLLTPLVLTSIFVAGGIIKEGAENMKDGDKKTVEDASKPKEAAKKPVDSNTVKPQKDKKKPDAKPDSKKEVVIGDMGEDKDIPTEDAVGTTEEPAGHTPETAESGMTTMYKKGNRVDYASTVEDAYGDLNNLLGSDGIKRLTDDTQKLMGQQMQLAEAMKSMTPLLSQAKSLMAGFDMKQFGDITAMAKQFGAAN